MGQALVSDTASRGTVEWDEGHFGRGTNQSGMRDANERLVLSLVRRHGSLSKSDLARMTGLSAQTVSVIMRELEAEELLVRGDPIRGKVGQPSVPLALNPDGAYFLGLKIGRRSADLVLVDFLGRVRENRGLAYDYPSPEGTVGFVNDSVPGMAATLTLEQQKRIAGLGIAMPFELWNWGDAVGAPADIMNRWRDADIRAKIASHYPFPVYVQNDATAACGAELVFGDTGGLRDFLYFYIGSFIGGGVVLNGAVYAGRTGNAGALGSMPVPGHDGKPHQLIDIASLAALERALNAAGHDASFLWTSPSVWDLENAELRTWISSAGAGIAYAVMASASVVDFEAAVIDGWLPETIRSRIVAAVGEALQAFDREGITTPAITAGTVGIHARALGGACLPLFDRFLTQQRLSKD